MIKPNYVCHYRIKKQGIPFLMCANQLVEHLEDYKTLKDCEKIICGHQYFCNKVGRWENTKDAERCPLNK